MAKIVTITNPLTGQPAQVDQLDHTAQQIDDGLNIARGVSNPNLLDNWYFGNPVDQRGGYVVLPNSPIYKGADTSLAPYTTDKYIKVDAYNDNNWCNVTIDGDSTYRVWSVYCVRGYTGAGYGIDRWMNENDKVVSTLENGLLKLTFSGVSTYMQKVQAPAGVQVTCSVLVENISGNLFLLWQDIESYSDSHLLQLSKGMNTLTVTTTKQNYRFAIYSSTADAKTISLVGVKLELGTQQTLAHQDSSGKWVLNEIPDYGEQLRRCQRHFIRIHIPVNAYIPVTMYGGELDTAHFQTPLPNTMRTVPSCTFSGKGRFVASDGSIIVPTSIVAVSNGSTENAIAVTINFDARQSAVFGWFDGSSDGIYIDANAEL